MHEISLCHRPRNCNLSNLCGRCKSLAPEIVSRGISCASGERLAALAFRLRWTLAPSALALALRARFSSRLRCSYLGQLPRIESLTKTAGDGEPVYFFLKLSISLFLVLNFPKEFCYEPIIGKVPVQTQNNTTVKFLVWS